MNNNKLYTMKLSIRFFIIVCSVFSALQIFSQQDPHYTQYTYNTMSINPAYTGFKGYGFLSATARTQWLGLEGAPNTQNISFDTSVDNGIGLGVHIVNDVLGPLHELSFDGNISYTIDVGNHKKLALGLRLGARILDIDWTRGIYYQKFDPIYKENFYKVLPTVGTGIYYYRREKWYIGLSVPNLLRSESYSQNLLGVEVISADKMHLYLIMGYVFTINDDIKFKPSSLIKAVSGAPVSIDVSANLFFYEKFDAGISLRWDDAISAVLGVQITEAFRVGYSYDLTTSKYSISNTGTHELMLQYKFFTIGGPRSYQCF